MNEQMRAKTTGYLGSGRSHAIWPCGRKWAPKATIINNLAPGVSGWRQIKREAPPVWAPVPAPAQNEVVGSLRLQAGAIGADVSWLQRDR